MTAPATRRCPVCHGTGRADSVRQPLTKRQRQVWDFLQSFIARQGYAPTNAEICQALDLRSLASAHEHLQNLARKGWIAREFNQARSIQLLGGDAT